MSLFKHFISNFNKKEHQNAIHAEIDALFPEYDENEKVTMACVAGLMARVVYADMNIDEKEKEIMQKSLKKYSSLEQKEVNAVVDFALKNIVDLAGLENHKYCGILAENWDHEKRFQLLSCLFYLAAADDNVDHLESEEIRTICTGLLLEHKHYIAARALVSEYLGVLKK